jgi:hypothetical protein
LKSAGLFPGFPSKKNSGNSLGMEVVEERARSKPELLKQMVHFEEKEMLKVEISTLK